MAFSRPQKYIFPQGAYDAAFQMSSFICSHHIEFNLQHAELSNLKLGLFLNILHSLSISFHISNRFMSYFNTFCVFP